jgi:hypothetical protein
VSVSVSVSVFVVCVCMRVFSLICVSLCLYLLLALLLPSRSISAFLRPLLPLPLPSSVSFSFSHPACFSLAHPLFLSLLFSHQFLNRVLKDRMPDLGELNVVTTSMMEFTRTHYQLRSTSRAEQVVGYKPHWTIKQAITRLLVEYNSRKLL